MDKVVRQLLLLLPLLLLTEAGKLNKARSYKSPKKETWKKDGLD